MGICASCCDDAHTEIASPSAQPKHRQVHVNQPDVETRRQLQAEAAEKRAKETEKRGIADPEKVKRQQKKQADMDRALEQSYPSEREGGLRWTTG